MPGFSRHLLQPADLFLGAPGWDLRNGIPAGAGSTPLFGVGRPPSFREADMSELLTALYNITLAYPEDPGLSAVRAGLG